MQLVFPIEMLVSDIPSLPGLLRVDGPKKVFIFTMPYWLVLTQSIRPGRSHHG